MQNVTKITVRLGADPVPQTFTGRTAWALDRLIQAGEVGTTPIESPGPRWSDYVFKLRRRGLAVETIDERHGGAYRGTHARYVLRTDTAVLEREVAA